MAFTLPDLPYAHDALAALGMSKETLEYHHDLHHKAYVDNGNQLIAGTPWESKSLDEIVVDGIRTNIPLHQQLVRDEAFMRVGVSIHYLEKKLKS